MNARERLFAAIGGADPVLIVRSEKGRGFRWRGYFAAAAACLVLVLALGNVLLSRTGPAITPSEIQKPDAGSEPFLLPEQGGEIGTLRLLSYAPQSQAEAVDFLIYVNEEQFSIYEENGLYRIRSTTPLPEDFPECGLDILHFPGISPTEAKEIAEKTLRERYGEGVSQEESAILPDDLYLRAGMGTEWDSEQEELWFVDDGQEGTFILDARYFLEAEEGLGMWFRDMVSSFRVVSLNETVPEWMRSLYAAADRLFPALFAHDLSGVSDLLAEGADADAYDQNVWTYITIISVDYTLDNDQDPTEAAVSVKHRLNQVEGESFSYLTMKLVRRNGSWYLAWSGIEK